MSNNPTPNSSEISQMVYVVNFIEPDKIIIPIARDMFIEKNLEESIKIMEERLEANNKVHAKLIENYNEITGKIQEIKSQFNQR